jgi:hypothetical protein
MAKLTTAELALTAQDVLKRLGKPPASFAEFGKVLIANKKMYQEALSASARAVEGHEFATQVSDEEGLRLAFSEVAQNIHFLGTWAQYGFNVFELTHGLSAGLLLTDPGEYDHEQFKLPFPALLIRIPPGTIPVWGVGQEMVWAASIWTYLYEDTEGDPSIRVTLRTNVGTDLWFRRKLKALYLDTRPFCPLISPGASMAKEDDISFDRAIRILRNLASWLQSTGGMEKRSTQSRPPRKKGEPEPVSANTWVLGKEVKLSRELREAATEIAQGSKREGWELRVRYIVRGHWRNQAHGPNRSLRRQQWIEPFWKGPEDGQQWSHLYQTQ